MLDGQAVKVGFTESLTVTVNAQLASGLSGLASLAVQLTLVTPLLKVEPEVTVPVVAPDAVQVTVTPGQLSVAVTVNGTAALHAAEAVDVVMLDGQAVNVGGVVSFTVNVVVHVPVCPTALVAVTVIVCGPSPTSVPAAGL